LRVEDDRVDVSPGKERVPYEIAVVGRVDGLGENGEVRGREFVFLLHPVERRHRSSGLPLLEE
jgi:hypothetical protein